MLKPEIPPCFGDHCDAFFQKAIEADKPFNLCVGFHDPHRDQSRGGFANNHGPLNPRVKDIEGRPECIQVPDWLTDVPELRQEPAEQLFDLENDPLEVNDLAKDSAYAEILKDLQNRLETWQIKTEDLWFYKDGQSVKGLEVWLGTDEMMMPNRHDFDPDEPSLKAPGVKLMKVKGDPIGIRGATLYGGKGRQIE